MLHVVQSMLATQSTQLLPVPVHVPHFTDLNQYAPKTLDYTLISVIASFATTELTQVVMVQVVAVQVVAVQVVAVQVVAVQVVMVQVVAVQVVAVQVVAVQVVMVQVVVV